MKKCLILSLLFIFLFVGNSYAAVSYTMKYYLSSTAIMSNGGGFKPGASGENYALGKDTARWIGTITATRITTIYDMSAVYSAGVVGNIICVNSTNGIYSRYEIISNTGIHTLRVDRPCNYSGVRYHIGGAVNLTNTTQDDAFFESATALNGTGANIFYVKAGIYTPGTLNFATIGGTQAHITIKGYVSSPDDTPVGTTGPTFNCGTGIFTLGSNWDIKYCNYTGTGTSVLTLGTNSVIHGVSVTNTSGTAGRIAVTTATNSLAVMCNFSSTNGDAVLKAAVNGVTLLGCVIHDSVGGLRDTASSTANAAVIVSNCIFKNNTNSVRVTGVAIHRIFISNCTFYGAETPVGTGINLAAGTYSVGLFNNIFYGLTTAITHANTNVVLFGGYNNFYNNTTNRTNWAEGINEVAFAPQFVDAANGDFTPGTNLRAIGFPGTYLGLDCTGYTDLGAVQRKKYNIWFGGN